ncbi:MAG: MlaC/ttg2D family ABC transporter substrate-binding protein [Noviherbaspirillum sp.]
MKTFSQYWGAAKLAFVALLVTGNALAQEAPDALVKRLSQEVLDTIKSEKELQSGEPKRALELVEAKILPHVDFEKTTALTVGRFWREATPEQQKQLVLEFRILLVYTYSGALRQVKDQKLEFKPLRADPADTEVEVRSQVLQARGGEPIQVNYRLSKTAGGWKIYDVNVMGVWLIATYKESFSAEINKGGMDGLIQTLADKNRALAAKPPKARKSS